MRGGSVWTWSLSTAADYIEVNAGAVICAEGAVGSEKLGEVLGDIRRKVANAGAAQGFLLDSLIERLGKVVDKMQRSAMSEARGGYKKWLADALMNGSRAAHRATCAEWTPPRVTVTCGVRNVTFETPALALKNCTETWSTTWQRNASEGSAGSDALTAARVKVLRDECDLIEWATFERVINASKGASGVGGDFIECADQGRPQSCKTGVPLSAPHGAAGMQMASSSVLEHGRPHRQERRWRKSRRAHVWRLPHILSVHDASDSRKASCSDAVLG